MPPTSGRVGVPFPASSIKPAFSTGCASRPERGSAFASRHLVPAYWAQYVGKSRIYFHGPSHEVILADFASEEAWRQGCPLAQLRFNQAIHAEVLWLDAELAKHGGGARFNHDDGYAFGPPDVVFELAEEFERRLEPLGLAIAIPKSECFSRGHAGDLRKHPNRLFSLIIKNKSISPFLQ